MLLALDDAVVAVIVLVIVLLVPVIVIVLVIPFLVLVVVFVVDSRSSSSSSSSLFSGSRLEESAIVATVLTAEVVVLSGLKACAEVSLECRCCICAQNLPSDASAMPACHICFNTPWA